jgi:hypothetical protein
MSRVDELPPDQRAALSVLLRQHHTYAEVASMLGIGEQAVHDRAHAALAILAPAKARGLDPEQRADIGDYLLGQQESVGDRLRTRTLLSDSQAASDWAHALAFELEELTDGQLPEIPELIPPISEESTTPVKEETAAAPSKPYPLSQAAMTAPSATTTPQILVLSGGGSHKKNGTTTTTKTTHGTTTEGRFALHAPSTHEGSIGTVEILAEGEKRAFYIQAEHIPITNHFFYAIWLYNSPTSALPLSKSPPVGKSHKLAGAALLPSNAGDYREILLTRETSTRPTHPGPVVLRGTFTLKS